jgi:hypothetical protein
VRAICPNNHKQATWFATSCHKVAIMTAMVIFLLITWAGKTFRTCYISGQRNGFQRLRNAGAYAPASQNPPTRRIAAIRPRYAARHNSSYC